MLSKLTVGAVVRSSAILLLVAAGIGLRMAHLEDHGSDVLLTTRAAIDVVLAGGNPYGRGFDVSTPPGSPFAYGPLALLWYALLPDNIELISSIAVVVLMAATGRVLGLTICALWVPLANLASDGSNDTSAGLLLLGALVLAERSPRLGAVGLAVAVAFKPYALSFLAPLLAYGGSGVLLPFFVASGLAWAPAALLWGVDPIVTSFRMTTTVHDEPLYSLADWLDAPVAAKPTFAIVQLISGLVASSVSLLAVRSARAMVLWGIAIYTVTLFTGWWATVAYWAAVVPIACWHLDAWIREASPGGADSPLPG